MVLEVAKKKWSSTSLVGLLKPYWDLIYIIILMLCLVI